MLNEILNWYYIVLNNLKTSLAEMFFYAHVKIYFIVSVLANIILWGGARAIVTLSGEDQIALHYNIDAGIDYYGQAIGVYSVPTLGSIIILVNFLVYWFLAYSKDRKFISHLLLSNAMVANIILLTAIYLIYLVNFR